MVALFLVHICLNANALIKQEELKAMAVSVTQEVSKTQKQKPWNGLMSSKLRIKGGRSCRKSFPEHYYLR